MRTLILLSLGAVPSQLFRWFVRRPEAPPGTRSRLGELCHRRCDPGDWAHQWSVSRSCRHARFDLSRGVLSPRCPHHIIGSIVEAFLVAVPVRFARLPQPTIFDGAGFEGTALSTARAIRDDLSSYLVTDIIDAARRVFGVRGILPNELVSGVGPLLWNPCLEVSGCPVTARPGMASVVAGVRGRAARRRSGRLPVQGSSDRRND
jgi:hypothetical protein